MGPVRNGQAISLAEKDKEISRLKLQLKAQAAQTSLMQSRLLATQNALDTLQFTHDEEVRAEQETADKWRQRLVTYYEDVKSARAAKDDLCHAVDSFLRRVEEPNSTWPKSQMHISSLIEPLDSKLLKRRNQDASDTFDDDLMKYAASMIEALVCERDLAREAYRSFFLDARAQIATLEAELAHRDYELEKCMSHCSDCPHFQREVFTRTDLRPLSPLDPDTVLKVLQKTTIRHKSLEQGNKELEKRLAEFRRNIAAATNAQAEYVPENRQEQRQDAPVGVQDDSDLTIRLHGGGRGTSSALEDIGRTSNLIAQMDRDVRELGLKVEALSSEGARMQKFIAESARNSTSSDHEMPEPKSTDPEMSSKQDEDSLRREKALIDDSNVKLVEMLHHSYTLPEKPLVHSASEYLPPSTELLDADDGEISMELATPLLPTTFIHPEKSQEHNDSIGPAPQAQLESSLFAQAPSSPRSPRLDQPEGIGTINEAAKEPGLDIAGINDEDRSESDTADLRKLAGELASTEEQIAESERDISDLADLKDDSNSNS